MVDLVWNWASEAAQRAALLSKCDLSTEMVKELTELQGVVGGLYARAQASRNRSGRRSTSTQARQHGGLDPATVEGRLVSLADKRHPARLSKSG
jgi:glycyl-tRNA synthetase beta chain